MKKKENKPVEPQVPAQTPTTAESTVPAAEVTEMMRTADPVQSEESVQTEETIQPEESAQTEETVQPEESVQAEETAQPEESAKQEATHKSGFLDDVLDLLESVAVSVFVVLMLFTFVFCFANVDGDSMVPTLNNGDRLLVLRMDRDYENGDVLILESDEAYTLDENGALVEGNGLDKRIVKRLIATGGQTVRIDFESGIVYVDDQALDEPYVNTPTHRDEGAFEYPITVPEGYVFVLGDNRNISKDSRHPDVGLVPESDIIGKVWMRIGTVSSFGSAFERIE